VKKAGKAAGPARSGDELVFLALGGAGEIGMNLNAYGYGPPDAREWIIADVGVTFAGQTMPGVDLILPDPTFLEDQKLLGIILTHAHEDHIGAIGHLWPRLKAPIYATPFTAYLVREKLREAGLEARAKVTEAPLGGVIELGPFRIELITLTHSIPEPNGLAIRTPLGVVWHTGDWKIDPEPQIGAATDVAAVQSLSEDGVLAMVCDSTNVFVEGHTGSEGDVRRNMAELIASKTGKVAVACFASNVARLESAMLAGRDAGREICLVGRSMHRITGAARSVGLLEDAPRILSEEEASRLRPENVLYLCTGSQGEPRAALTRIAEGGHRQVQLGAGDCVIFSSRVIPGNELPIYALYNRLADRGVEVITDRDWPIHVSGHPARDELTQMYRWARPQIAVPVHGERRHLLEHAKLARALQVPEAIAPRNGEIVRLAPGPAAIIDEVPAGRLVVDGGMLVEEEDDSLRDRRRLGEDGHVSIAIALGKKGGIAGGPDVKVRGLAAGDEEDLEDALDDLARAAEIAFDRLSLDARRDADAAEQAIVRGVRKAAEKIWGKRPFVDVLIVEI
jgi:ribonuclease J